MLVKQVFLIIVVSLIAAFAGAAGFDARQNAVTIMQKTGLEGLLTAPVRVTVCEQGSLLILDEGIFLVQHEIVPLENACEPNVLIDPSISICPSVDKLVIITHGWLDKGKGRWPSEMACAVQERVDPNEWLCGSFDWKGGSGVITSIHAAQYARDVAGPRLAAAVRKLDRPWKHIHLIGHSAGAWAIQAAAEQLAYIYPQTVFHLTFLDAYVPARWDPHQLGLIFEDPAKQRNCCWAEHYYTKDYTLTMTQHDLPWAHNVNISALDPFITEHEFPYRWYTATITGTYGRWDEKDLLVQSLLENTDYGFARSLESASENWISSQHLPVGNKAFVFRNGLK